MSKKENKLLKEEEKILNFLDKASNDELISYFEEKKEKGFLNEMYHPKIKEIHTKISKNKNKGVQLAIIKYGPDDKLREKYLLNGGDKKIRLFLLEQDRWSVLFLGIFADKNPDDFIKFIKKVDDRELYVYFTNKNIRWSHLDALLAHKGSFKKITEKLYRNIILILEDNPNFLKEPDMNSYQNDDGYSWYLDKKSYKKFQIELKLIKKLRNLE